MKRHIIEDKVGDYLELDDCEDYKVLPIMEWLQSVMEGYDVTHINVCVNDTYVKLQPMNIYLETEAQVLKRIEANAERQTSVDAIMRKSRLAEYHRLKKEFEGEE